MSVKPTIKSFSWQLAAPREELWPLLSDTERINEALGLPAYRLHEEIDDYGRRLFGEYHTDDQIMRWEEQPMEWVAPHWWRWARDFESGPFESLAATLILAEGRTGGTDATYKLEALPRGAVGRMLLLSGHLSEAAKNFERLSRQAAAYSRDPQGAFFSRFFEAGQAPQNIAGSEIPPALQPLMDWIVSAPVEEVRVLRPKRIATALSCDVSEALQLCDRAARAELLEESVQLICESCNRVTQEASIPARIAPLGGCRHCGASVRRNLGKNVELIFRPANSLRELKDDIYCAGSPARHPDRILQQYVEGRERRRLEVASTGTKMRARILNGPVGEWVTTQAGEGLTVRFGDDWVEAAPNGDVISLENYSEGRVQILLEQAEGNADATMVGPARAVQCWHDRFDSLTLGLGQQEAGGAVAILAVRAPEGTTQNVLKALANSAGGAALGTMSGCSIYAFLSRDMALNSANAMRAAHPGCAIGASYGEVSLSGATATPSISGPPVEIAVVLADTAEDGGFEAADSFGLALEPMPEDA